MSANSATGFMIENQKEWHNFKRRETLPSIAVVSAAQMCIQSPEQADSVSSGWGECPLPICVGHEIVGRVVAVGKTVKTVKIGDRVGVGAQVQSDLTCTNCLGDQENYCSNMIDTYGSLYPDGTISQGGFSSHIRAHEYFTFKIPDAIESEVAAPMLCAGITVYSPLVRLGAEPGKRLAVVGLGGLGHFAVMFAVALGAEVYVLSHTPSKRGDALKMGAKQFVVTGTKDWHKPYQFTFDLILNTTDALHSFVLPDYFSTLKVNGHFHTVGFGDHPLPSIMAQSFAPNGCYFGASHIGNRPEMIAMFDLAAACNLKSWIQPVPISRDGCAQVVKDVHANNGRYRYVLVEYDNEFGKRA
ncbi:hypothetical protein M409DRAFT_52645 [Zasmidium cellare ATCC 36951]|uniref:Enoyl reductase (ER) domain-containing protein n=1 Tax=Zasmidium cellare ATCC 36951 TaxID=1080233 RepID=A0A6A6CQ36_ZASCE|nr:uncharacterized protein M409DRAFT_52645 [Zasmidium cellare ATCC 36951]KAF2169397.1 hypothetical protein M409DRAFT_52645 [Zasmidium cellare ATCC 36951]